MLKPIEVKVADARVLLLLLGTGAECLPGGQREAWTERLLGLVLREDTPPPLRAAAGNALGGAAA